MCEAAEVRKQEVEVCKTAGVAERECEGVGAPWVGWGGR